MPLLGIIISDDELRMKIDWLFHWPMIVVALLVLPLLGVDFLYLAGHEERRFTTIWWICVIGSFLVWLAFLVEFVVKITIAESRLEYTKRNWLDVVIILLPIVGWLRVSRLARTTRVFRLRGVGMKFARHVLTVLLGLQITERVLERFGVNLKKGRHDPAAMTRYQLMDEVKRRRRQVDAWEAWYEAHQKHIEKHGGEALPAGPPDAAATGAAPADKPPDELDEAHDVEAASAGGQA